MTHAFFTTSAEIPFGLTSDQTVQEHARQEREKHFLLSPFEEEQLSIRMSGGCLALLGTPPCVLIGNGSVQFLMTLWLSNQFNSVQLLLFSFCLFPFSALISDFLASLSGFHGAF